MTGAILAAQPAAQPLAKSGEALKAGPIGLAVILLLCIACYFLFKSMSKHLRSVRDNFPEAPPTRLGADRPTARPTTAHSPPASMGRPPTVGDATEPAPLPKPISVTTLGKPDPDSATQPTAAPQPDDDRPAGPQS